MEIKLRISLRNPLVLDPVDGLYYIKEKRKLEQLTGRNKCHLFFPPSNQRSLEMFETTTL